ncbi:MAG: hypothetical protein IT320_21700 [Anaerolineae bacterium]|nr:hypothetical protein [Anaerolineae bacterium]
MKASLKWSAMIGAVVIALMGMAVGIVSADDEEIVLPSIDDGRVNNFDIAAPVAVFCEFTYPYADDTDAGVLDSIQLWGLTGADDGLFHEVATISAAQIDAASASSTQPVLLSNTYGYSVYLEADGSFRLVAAPDAEGKVYEFSWDLSAPRC